MVYKTNYTKKKGDKVIGPEDRLPDVLCEVIVVSSASQEEAINEVRKIVEQTEAPIIEKRKGAERKFYFPSHAYPFKLVSSKRFSY